MININNYKIKHHICGIPAPWSLPVHLYKGGYFSFKLMYANRWLIILQHHHNFNDIRSIVNYINRNPLDSYLSEIPMEQIDEFIKYLHRINQDNLFTKGVIP